MSISRATLRDPGHGIFAGARSLPPKRDTVHRPFAEDPPADEPLSDADLVLRSRSGDAEAFAILWERHYSAGIAVARSITPTIDADDLVQEAFTRIFQVVRRGGGPTGAFRAYLFTAIRNTAASWGRSRREVATDELDALVDPDSTDAARLEEDDRTLTHRAFRSLPTRWQEVLWYTSVEGLGPAEAAPLLAMKPNAVKQLAFRAREGLREAWIQAHIASLGTGSDCRWAASHLGAHTRGNLASRHQARFDAHLGACSRCTLLAAEADEVGSRLAFALLPLFIGVTATASYLLEVGRGQAAIALAATPAELVEGTVLAGGGIDLGTPAWLAGSGTTGAATAGAAGGTLSVGGFVGAGMTTVGVAGAIVASTVVPSFVPGDPASASVSASLPATPEDLDLPDADTTPADAAAVADPAALPSALTAVAVPLASPQEATSVAVRDADDPAPVAGGGGDAPDEAPVDGPRARPDSTATDTVAVTVGDDATVGAGLGSGEISADVAVPGLATVGADIAADRIAVGVDAGNGLVSVGAGLDAGGVAAEADVAGIVAVGAEVGAAGVAADAAVADVATVTATVDRAGIAVGAAAASDVVAAEATIARDEIAVAAGAAGGAGGTDVTVTRQGVDVGLAAAGLDLGVAVGGEDGGVSLTVGGLLD